MRKTVPERIMELADLSKGRSAQYNNTWHESGKIYEAIFPRGVTLKNEDDFGRYALFVQILNKLHRYAVNFERGGHIDSLDDLSVYAQMLQELDDKINSEKENSK